MFKEATTLETTFPKLRRVACTWFDFELTHQIKSTLLEAFPQMLAHLPSEAGKVQPVDTPKGKEAVLNQLTQLFVATLPTSEQIRLREGAELPKHFLQPELQAFLKTVQGACERTAHRPAFKV